MKKSNGFTLIELMIVVSIIGILAAVALPAYQPYIFRAHIAEPLSYAGNIKQSITQFYADSFSFPHDNKQARLPEPDKLISNKIASVEVKNGAFHILLGNKVPEPLKGKYITFRPAVVKGSPRSPITWLCGYAKPVEGMSAVGENKTDVDEEFLPGECVF
ncbi:pilin [Endozoicomonas sp. G2_1]|uniref:pilin n=1 Tax=Endozoicomonas sp. G2_1 TaxID=2821091 RepID=UPI001ADB4624|nr:pilin [Endozoicomonas sp. G2_1]MBO9489513.1 pilin [Endozoicomonas sp. G2_1]